MINKRFLLFIFWVLELRFFIFIVCGGYSSIGVGIKSCGSGIISDSCSGRGVIGCGSSSSI